MSEGDTQENASPAFQAIEAALDEAARRVQFARQSLIAEAHRTRDEPSRMALIPPALPADTLTIYNRTLTALMSSPDERGVSEALCEAALMLLPGTAGAVCLFREEDDLSIVAAWDGTRHWLRYNTEHSQDREVLQSVTNKPSEQAIGLPLLGMGVTAGELRCWLDSEAQRKPAEFLALSGGMAFGGLTLRHRLRHHSVRDGLTGLFNRRYLEDTLAREIHRSKRNKAPLGLILCDLDHFGGFNDRHGFDGGDKVLQALAGLLQASFRGSDVCCRYDGGRFAVILPDASLANTQQRAEEIKDLVREISVTRRGETLSAITASLGIAAYPEHASDVGEMIAAAESALFLTKQSGGNSVSVAEKVE